MSKDGKNYRGTTLIDAARFLSRASTRLPRAVGPTASLLNGAEAHLAPSLRSRLVE